MIITVDGPAGVGKGTLARSLASHFGLPYLDTGLLFRSLALECCDKSCDLASENDILAVLQSLDFAQGVQEEALRNERVAEAASLVAVFPAVRAAMAAKARAWASDSPRGAVVDGRDGGTVLFPQAGYKVFLTATASVRARRRFTELDQRGKPVQFEALLEEIKTRDKRDSSRENSPLRPALDAFVLDTSDMNAAQVLERVLAFIADKEKKDL